MATDEKLFDKRIVQRSIRKGLISQEAVQDYLRGLPDKSNQLESVSAGETTERGAPGASGT